MVRGWALLPCPTSLSLPTLGRCINSLGNSPEPLALTSVLPLGWSSCLRVNMEQCWLWSSPQAVPPPGSSCPAPSQQTHRNSSVTLHSVKLDGCPCGCCDQEHMGFNWQWNYLQKRLLKCNQGKVLFYWAALFSQPGPRWTGKTCYVQCAFGKIGVWTVSLASRVTLGPYHFLDTEILCRDLAVRSLNIKILTSYCLFLKKYYLLIGGVWNSSFF